jgi:hypothetical protein
MGMDLALILFDLPDNIAKPLRSFECLDIKLG